MEVKKTVDAPVLAKLFLAGAKYLEANKEHINELNVFPVPDGDTGTNMSMTIQSAAKDVASLEKPDMKSVSKAISSGSLRGARGNSGVILSQLFRGFTKVVKKEELLTVPILTEAMQKACETAYRAVMKPMEGTILTVARGAADKALELSEMTDDILYFADEVVKEAEAVLEKTPEMLPVLKQAGVVDSGGQGLVEVLRGARDYLAGKEIDLSMDASLVASPSIAETLEGEKTKEIKYGYHTSFVLIAQDAFAAGVDEKLKTYFASIGGDVAVSAKGKEMTISLQTNEPGRAITRALKFGSIKDVVIQNQMLQAAQGSLPAEDAPVEDAAPTKDIGFVAVSVGEGLSGIFKELGADVVIQGGQTMNPSTEDILSAIAQTPAKHVFVLPNNKNIILAADQAKKLCAEKDVIVLPTKTIPQGITALVNFIADQPVSENESRMKEEIARVKSGEVTYAVRDTVIEDKQIHEGDYMGIGDQGILAVDQSLDKAFLDMVAAMVDAESSLLSMYYGSDVEEADATRLRDLAAEKFPDLEIELQPGGQPVYYYVVSVE